MSDEFISFDQALDELRLKEDELKKLVSEGEIRAFRKGETMKLRQSDVDALRRELGGDVVDMDGAEEELVFEDDDLDGDGGMATQEMEVDMDTLLEEDVEDLGELEFEEEAADEDEEEIEEAVPVAAAVEEEEMHPGLMAAVLTSVAVMILFVPVAMALSKGRVSGGAKLVGGFMGKKFDYQPAVTSVEETPENDG